MDSKLVEVLSRFQYKGKLVSIDSYGGGLINHTMLVTTTTNKYIFQSLNVEAFHNIDNLMRNIFIVSSFLIGKGFVSLNICKTKKGYAYAFHENAYYRLYDYIDDVVCYEQVKNNILIRKTGQAFGKLHRVFLNIDPILIAETIPDFHNTPKRLLDFYDSMKVDYQHRLSDCQKEIDFIIANRKYLSMITDGLEMGTIPTRIVHNDPKINNVLFDKKTNKVKSIIDLDTVMPGSVLYDFGDGLRYLFSGDNESSDDISSFKVSLPVYRAFAKGYLSQMKNNLNEEEKRLLPYSILIMTIEVGMRFITDYLNGDKYFHIKFENENYIRGRNQIVLAKNIIKNMDKLVKITEEILERCK